MAHVGRGHADLGVAIRAAERNEVEDVWRGTLPPRARRVAERGGIGVDPEGPRHSLVVQHDVGHQKVSAGLVNASVVMRGVFAAVDCLDHVAKLHHRDQQNLAASSARLGGDGVREYVIAGVLARRPWRRHRPDLPSVQVQASPAHAHPIVLTDPFSQPAKLLADDVAQGFLSRSLPESGFLQRCTIGHR